MSQFNESEKLILESAIKKHFQAWNNEIENYIKKLGSKKIFTDKQKEIKQIEKNILLKVKENTFNYD